MSNTQPIYVPALRMKAGELSGLRGLASDVADRILPRIVVPPLAERDQGLQAQLFETETQPNIASALASHWRGRGVFVDATHLLSECGCDSVETWLPNMLERVRDADVIAVPLVAFRDLTIHTRKAYQAACAPGPIRIAVVINSSDLVDRDGLSPLLNHLAAMELSPSDCAVIADFADSEFGQAEIVAPIIEGALQLLQDLGVWRLLVFQGTNYPDHNPATAGNHSIIPRNEWLAWRQAVRFDPATAEHMLFGDYAADCAKMEFGDGGGRAIRHYRYATPEAWLVQRGEKIGTDALVMRNVCINILESGHFAGRAFSSADEYIFQTAHGHAGPGNSTIWRAINTTHHITRVVADIGHVRGFQLKRGAVQPMSHQADMFTEPADEAK